MLTYPGMKIRPQFGDGPVKPNIDSQLFDISAQLECTQVQASISTIFECSRTSGKRLRANKESKLVLVVSFGTLVSHCCVAVVVVGAGAFAGLLPTKAGAAYLLGSLATSGFALLESIRSRGTLGC